MTLTLDSLQGIWYHADDEYIVNGTTCMVKSLKYNIHVENEISETDNYFEFCGWRLNKNQYNIIWENGSTLFKWKPKKQESIFKSVETLSQKNEKKIPVFIKNETIKADSNLAQEIVEMQEDVKYLKQNDELNINLHKSIRDTQEKLNARICDLENISLTLQSDDTDNASPYSKLLKEKSSNGNNYFHVPASEICLTCGANVDCISIVDLGNLNLAYKFGYVCDICEKTSPTELLTHCPLCWQDVCSTCRENGKDNKINDYTQAFAPNKTPSNLAQKNNFIAHSKSNSNILQDNHSIPSNRRSNRGSNSRPSITPSRFSSLSRYSRNANNSSDKNDDRSKSSPKAFVDSKQYVPEVGDKIKAIEAFFTHSLPNRDVEVDMIMIVQEINKEGDIMVSNTALPKQSWISNQDFDKIMVVDKKNTHPSFFSFCKCVMPEETIST